MTATATLVHLSDLHLHRRTHCNEPDCKRPECQSPDYNTVTEKLAAALKATGVRDPAVVLITGDLFDSSTTDHRDARAMLRKLVEGVRGALATPGEVTPIIVLPGNHDRRNMGVVGKNDSRLFEALREQLPPGVQVLGVDRNFFASKIDLSGVPAIVVAYDSTYLPGGLISAGGTIRSEELLQLAAKAERDDADLPLVLLMHHHLVPTPVTDTGPIGAAGKPWYARAILHAAPWFFPYGSREEPWMTAFGAGTALSTLHALGRAVLVLHGHKHYPTARILKATIQGDGDVLVASAGSAGLSEPWMHFEKVPGKKRQWPVVQLHGTTEVDGEEEERETEARPTHPELWPSFNLVNISEARIDIETVAFSLKNRLKRIVRRPLVAANRASASWATLLVRAPGITDVRLVTNVATYRLLQRTDFADEYDLRCKRVLKFAKSQTKRILEGVQGLDDGALEQGTKAHLLPVTLSLGAGTTKYTIRRAACRTVERAARESTHEAGTAFEWVGLPNRYGAAKAVFHVEGLPDGGAAAFGSVTDMNTGREIPVRLERADGRVTLRVADCPARRLLRVYWPLEAEAIAPAKG